MHILLDLGDIGIRRAEEGDHTLPRILAQDAQTREALIDIVQKKVVMP